MASFIEGTSDQAGLVWAEVNNGGRCDLSSVTLPAVWDTLGVGAASGTTTGGGPASAGQYRIDLCALGFGPTSTASGEIEVIWIATGATGGSVAQLQGSAPGSKSLFSLRREHELTLILGMVIGSVLQRSGHEVRLTRNEADARLSNVERAQVANSFGADLFLRVHLDGRNDALRWIHSVKSGTMTLVPGPRHPSRRVFEESVVIGARLHDAALQAARLRDRGIHIRDDLAGFNHAQMPCVLLEVANLSNPFDESVITSPGFAETLAGRVRTVIDTM
jgi:N-acetylmuramoyl-L-alanine amidase